MPFCPCGMFYIGKTIRQLHVRVHEHLYLLRTGKGAPRLILHMREVHNNDPSLLRFAGLRKIPIPQDGSDRHVALL